MHDETREPGRAAATGAGTRLARRHLPAVRYAGLGPVFHGHAHRPNRFLLRAWFRHDDDRPEFLDEWGPRYPACVAYITAGTPYAAWRPGDGYALLLAIATAAGERAWEGAPSDDPTS